jgi:AIPR protein
MQDYKAQSGDLDLLYEKNVRKFLGNKRKVNRGIEKTLEQYPDRFGLHNNGITIVAEEVQKTGDDEVRLTNPFIVNGCQTTRSIWSVLQRRLNSGGGAPTEVHLQWQSQLEHAVVVTKIVVVGTEGEDLLTETTRYTNSQNAVAEKDFMALEEGFRNWAPAFNAKFGVFLEIQRGAWEARRAYQRQHPSELPKYEETANAFELLKAYVAGWLCEPGIAYGKNPPFAPGGSLFHKIVSDPGFGIDSMFAAYQSRRWPRYIILAAERNFKAEVKPDTSLSWLPWTWLETSS